MNVIESILFVIALMAVLMSPVLLIAYGLRSSKPKRPGVDVEIDLVRQMYLDDKIDAEEFERSIESALTGQPSQLRGMGLVNSILKEVHDGPGQVTVYQSISSRYHPRSARAEAERQARVAYGDQMRTILQGYHRPPNDL